MEAEDPAPSGAKTHWGDPGDLDTAPVFTTRQHLDYLVGLITEEWRNTTVKLTNASADIGNTMFPDYRKLEYFDPEEDTVTKVDTSAVPQSIIQKVDNLRHMHRIGLPHLTNLMDLAKDDLAKHPLGTSASEEVEGDSDQPANFAGMLIKLAKSQMYSEIMPKQEIEVDLTVVFVDESGKMRLNPCRLKHSTDFASFLDLMDRYPQEYNLNVAWAEPFWDEKVQELKETGYDGHPKLGQIEQLIASFKARNYYAVPKWMFYKTNRRVSYAKPIESEHDLKMILEILVNSAKDNRLACMVRAVDKDIIFICDELYFFEERIEESVWPGTSPVATPAQGDQSDPSD